MELRAGGRGQELRGCGGVGAVIESLDGTGAGWANHKVTC